MKEIRKKTDFFKKKIFERNVKSNLSNLLYLDEKNRELIQDKEKLEHEKKIISQKKDKTQFKKSKEISAKIDQIIIKQLKIKSEIDSELSSLPNLALDDVPIGVDDKTNIAVRI